MQITTSANISNLDFDFEIDIAQQVPKAIITDISTYISGGETNIIGLVVRLIDPSNLQFTTTIYPPNVDIVPGLTSFSKNLPYFNGKAKFGIYKAYATLVDADGTLYEWSDTDTGLGYKTINLCQPNQLQNATGNWGGLNLDVNPNCDTGLLEVQDNGTGFSYNGVTPSVTEASLVITYPIDTTGTTAQATATFIPFKFPLTVSGIYSIVGTVTQTYQLTETTSVKAAYYCQNTFDINCGYTICKALCDYEKLVADVQSCSLKNPNEALQQLRTLILVIAYLGKIAWFKNCGKKFGNVLEQLRLIAGFACNCDCNPQGIAPAPISSGGTIVKGNMCGDMDMNLTQFMGNVRIDLSDVTYIMAVASDISGFVTFIPIEGECQKTYTLDIDVCAMLGSVSIGCLADVNVGSPAPSNGSVLVYNSAAGEWQAETLAAGMLYNNFADDTRTTVGDNKTYTMPANTLANDGDQLVIKAHITANQTSTPLIGVTDIYFGALILESMGIGNGLRQVDIEIQLIRVSNTTIRYMVSERRGIFNQIDSNYIYQSPSAVTAVPALSTNAINIRTTSSYFSGGVQINNELLSIELNKI